jgi:hypothetical protein
MLCLPRTLALSINSLTGTIPAGLGSLPQLQCVPTLLNAAPRGLSAALFVIACAVAPSDCFVLWRGSVWCGLGVASARSLERVVLNMSSVTPLHSPSPRLSPHHAASHTTTASPYHDPASRHLTSTPTPTPAQSPEPHVTTRHLYLNDNSLTGEVPQGLTHFGNTFLGYNCLTDCAYTRSPWCSPCSGPVSASPAPSASVTPTPSPTPSPSPCINLNCCVGGLRGCLAEAGQDEYSECMCYGDLDTCLRALGVRGAYPGARDSGLCSYVFPCVPLCSLVFPCVPVRVARQLAPIDQALMRRWVALLTGLGAG